MDIANLAQNKSVNCSSSLRCLSTSVIKHIIGLLACGQFTAFAYRNLRPRLLNCVYSDALKFHTPCLLDELIPLTASFAECEQLFDRESASQTAPKFSPSHSNDYSYSPMNYSYSGRSN